MSELVIWDLDRTLVDLHIELERVWAWKRTLAERFEPLGWTGAWSPLLPSLEAALEAVGATGQERDATYRDLDRWEFDALDGVTVHDELLNLVVALADDGVRQALVTNNGPRVCEVALDALAARARALGVVFPRLVPVLWRGPGRRAKPSPDAFRAAAQQDVVTGDGAGESALERALVIGDSPGDRQAAVALDARTPFDVRFIQAAAGSLNGVEATSFAGLWEAAPILSRPSARSTPR